MAEPAWKLALRKDVGAQVDPWAEYGWQEDAVLDAVLPHIEAAYKRGVEAGRSQREYGPRTRRKKKETD